MEHAVYQPFIGSLTNVFSSTPSARTGAHNAKMFDSTRESISDAYSPIGASQVTPMREPAVDEEVTSPARTIRPRQFGPLGPALRIPVANANKGSPLSTNYMYRTPEPKKTAPRRRPLGSRTPDESSNPLKEVQAVDTSYVSAASAKSSRSLRDMSTGPLRILKHVNPPIPSAAAEQKADTTTAIHAPVDARRRSAMTSAPSIVQRLSPKYAGLIEAADGDIRNNNTTAAAMSSTHAVVLEEHDRLAFEFEYDTIGPIEWLTEAPVAVMPETPALNMYGVCEYDMLMEENEDDYCSGDDGSLSGSDRTQSVHFDHEGAATRLLLSAEPCARTPNYTRDTECSVARTHSSKPVMSSTTPHNLSVARKLDLSEADIPTPQKTAYRVTQVFGKSTVQRMAVSPGPIRNINADLSVMDKSVIAKDAAEAALPRFGVPKTERAWRSRPHGAGDPVSLYQRTQQVRENFKKRMAQKSRESAMHRIDGFHSVASPLQ